MLRRPEGATVAQIAEATGWAQHKVRGVFAGLTKKGDAVEVKSRERMVGPTRTGANRPSTIYALAECEASQPRDSRCSIELAALRHSANHPSRAGALRPRA
jgi:predicted ArsR family transcriptional regulator